MKPDLKMVEKMCIAQSVQNVFMRMRLRDYLEVVSEMTGDPKLSEAFDELLAYTALETGAYLYDFAGVSESPLPVNEDITVGEMLCAAVNMLEKKHITDFDIDDDALDNILENTGRMLVIHILVNPFEALYKKRSAQNKKGKV